MPKSPEELEKMFTDLQTQQEKTEKEFKLQLQVAERNTQQYKELAEKNAEELRTFKQDAEKREKEQKAALEKKFASEISEFIESQVKAGKILPALKEKVTTFMKSLTSEGEVLKFQEKDGSTRSHTQLSLFKELILKMKPLIPVDSEFSVQEAPVAETPDNEEGLAPAATQKHFTEITIGGEKKRVEVDGVEEASKAYEYIELQAKVGKTVSYEEALIHVYKQLKNKKSAVKA